MHEDRGGEDGADMHEGRWGVEGRNERVKDVGVTGMTEHLSISRPSVGRRVFNRQLCRRPWCGNESHLAEG